MIRLGSYPGPDLSLDPYVVELKNRLSKYLRRPPIERAQRRAPIDEEFYFSEDVTKWVGNRCLGKCVFCERGSNLVRIEVGTFRPLRAAIDQHGHEKADYYAWLAYEPENLILICIECSSRKGTNFPIRGERSPYLATIEEVRAHEKPLLVDPYQGNPERHFRFLTDGRVEGVTNEGRNTISILGLDDGHLLEQRQLDLNKFLKQLHEAILDVGRLGDILLNTHSFASVRIGVARRLFYGMQVAGERVQGSANAFPLRLAQAIAVAGPESRDRLLNRIAVLTEEDASLSIDLDTYRPGDSVMISGESTHSIRPVTGGIARVEFRNFKGLNDLTVETLAGRMRSKGIPCLMLLGENAVGKSSILQGIALALIGAKEVKRLKIEPWEFLHADIGERWDQFTTKDANVLIEFRINRRTVEFSLDGATRKVVGGAGPATLVLGYGPHRYFDPSKSDRIDAEYARVRSLFFPKAALPHPGIWLTSLDVRGFEEVAKILRIILALSDADEVVHDVDGRICIRLDGAPVPIERLSEGYRSIFAMVVDIARELMRHFRHLEDAEAVILIDEIDTHLHPRWKMRVMGALRRALPRVQFIVTTHDPLCIRGMEDGEVVVLQRDKNRKITMLKDLPSIKGMRADQLLTSDFFGLSSTVDPETELDVARFVQAVGELPDGRVEEANRLVRQLVLGDGALEQVVQEALVLFLGERERPTGSLRTDVRKAAVQTILNALREDGDLGPGKEPVAT